MGRSSLPEAFKASRNRKIQRDWIEGHRSTEIAKRYGVSRNWVSMLGKLTGVSRKRGSPMLPYQGDDRKHYAKLRRIFGPDRAREMME